MTPNWHWSKQQNPEKILKRISETKKKNPTRYWLGKHLSPEHNAKLQEGRKKIKGERSPRWKGGITSEQGKIRNSLEYIIWRNEVWKRDYWTCRICKKHCEKGDIVAHHLKLFSDYQELRFAVENGITLCRSCHAKIHELNKKHTQYATYNRH